MKLTKGFRVVEPVPEMVGYPGQYAVPLSWPVLTAEVTPKPSTSSGMFAIDALVQPLGHLGLGREPGPAGLNVLGDVHCLTTWSKLGVSFTALSGNPSRRLRPRFRPFHTSYATNLPFTGVTGGKTWVVWECVGPLPVDHGGPARLLVPHLYSWKRAK
jgi:hypothetical protein